MIGYNLILRNNSNGNITKVKNGNISTIVKAVLSIRSKEKANAEIPNELMKRGKRTKEIKDSFIE